MVSFRSAVSYRQRTALRNCLHMSTFTFNCIFLSLFVARVRENDENYPEFGHYRRTLIS